MFLAPRILLVEFTQTQPLGSRGGNTPTLPHSFSASRLNFQLHWRLEASQRLPRFSLLKVGAYMGRGVLLPLTSPAMGHWGTCSCLIFWGHFRAADSDIRRMWLPISKTV